LHHLIEEKLRRLRIRCRRPVEHLLSGEYHSVFKGRGIEFDELRKYEFGDDVRAIDWRSLARSGEPYIRRYIEEREQAFILAIDISASEGFGSGERRKLDAAHETAALLAWSAARNNDRVGLLLFTSEVELFIPPSRGRRHVLRIISELVEFTPKNRGTDITAAIEFIGKVTSKRGIVFLVSDFLCDDYGESIKVLARRHDFTAVRVVDPAERKIPAGGLIEMRDAETGLQRLVDADISRGLNAANPGSDFQGVCQEAEIDWFEIGPDVDCVEALSSYFRARHRRIADETGG
jgi:uncharacterized protein (DUF58 family)